MDKLMVIWGSKPSLKNLLSLIEPRVEYARAVPLCEAATEIDGDLVWETHVEMLLAGMRISESFQTEVANLVDIFLHSLVKVHGQRDSKRVDD